MEKSKGKIVKIKIRESDGLETKLFLIKKLIFYKNPISIYKLSKDLKMPSSQIYYHFQNLIEQKIIIQTEKGYKLIDCFYHLSDHLEHLTAFFISLLYCHPELSEDELNNIANYILTISTLEIE